MKHILLTIITTLFASICSAQTVQGVEVYEISAMRGQQIYYASHIKAEHMKSAKLMDDEDRAALLGAIGKTGIAMPRLTAPYVDAECRMQESKITIIYYKDKDGEPGCIAKNEYNGGEDKLLVTQNEDAITCMLIGEGVTQIYTIHKNVTFPDGAKLITSQTTRNRPLGVSTMNLSGKATRVK
jgi:hypothetical protein